MPTNVHCISALREKNKTTTKAKQQTNKKRTRNKT